MRVLFLNYTFPGPFLQLAAAFGRMEDTTVLFAAEYGRRDFSLPGVQRVVLSRPRERNRKDKSLLSEQDRLEWDMSMAFQRGRMTASSFSKLREKGFVPDIVISSATMGNSLFLRAVFPETFWVAYGDWYFAREKCPATPGRASLPRNLSMWWRNNLQIRTLCESDWMVTSTKWQRKQYPPAIAENLHILPLCLDTEFFSPAPHEGFRFGDCDLSPVRELVTIAANGTPPSAFFRSLPLLLERRGACHVAILAGTDSPATAILLKEECVGPELAQRIHVLAFLPDDAYRALLRASSLYVSLPGSGMLSSGLWEAMSCGCLVLTEDTEAAREVIRDGKEGILRTLEKPSVLADTVAELLERVPDLGNIRTAARERMQRQYSVRNTIRESMSRLLRRYVQWREAFGGRDIA